MKVFKFGGASVKDAEAVRNMAGIIAHHTKNDLLIVVSAMGKNTNALEGLLDSYIGNDRDLVSEKLAGIRKFHLDVADGLDETGIIKEAIEPYFRELEGRLERMPSDNYDYDYDQIVSYGEILSTKIIATYLQTIGMSVVWGDARQLVRTDGTYREAKVNWEKTHDLVIGKWKELNPPEGVKKILLTQGFIGHTDERNTTTLGREGSDFSAAIFAYVLEADGVTIWKDVPGVLNADPKFFPDAVKLKRISYREAIELAYYGASVIHPKTIKPLQNKDIPLLVKSFQKPEDEGTKIDASTYSDSLVPSYIFKVDQILVSFTPRDFSFVNEDNLSELFAYFVEKGIKINLMQNSALNFSICIDYHKKRLDAILDKLQDRYEILYNHPCELVTIRHYNQETISRLLIGKRVLVEQRSRNTARMVLMES
jgi:aspartate kinase